MATTSILDALILSHTEGKAAWTQADMVNLRGILTETNYGVRMIHRLRSEKPEPNMKGQATAMEAYTLTAAEQVGYDKCIKNLLRMATNHDGKPYTNPES